MKTCPKCKIDKSFLSFGFSKDRKDKMQVYCKDCHSKYRNENRQKINEYFKINRNKISEKEKIERQTVNGCLKNLLKLSKTRARLNNSENNLTIEILTVFLYLQNFKCALTGLDFTFEYSGEFGRDPYRPSIDRIDNSKGYTVDNVQLICNMVNVAKNQYPQEMFDEMCRARVRMLDG